MPSQSASQSDHFERLTEACVEGGFRDAHETEVVSLWAHGEITRLRQGLWDCAIAAGMDHDGDLTPKHLASPDIVELALREVRELRRDCEEAEGGGLA